MNNVYGTIELDRLRCLEQRAALDDVACVVNRSRAPCPPVLIGRAILETWWLWFASPQHQPKPSLRVV
jgi:hypothetical protein